MPNIRTIGFKGYEYVLPEHQAYGMARGLNYRRNLGLIIIESDDGFVGYGEAGGPIKVLSEYVDLIRPFFIGRSIYDFDLIASGLYNRLYHLGVQSQLTAALSGVSIAMTDLIGRTHGIAAHDLLGGKSHDKFLCYATSGYFTKNDEQDFAAQIQEVAERNFRAVKIKIGRSPSSDLERVKIARQILGDGPLLMVDVNGNYTPDVALESLRAIAPYNIHWCEEPVPPTDLRGYIELRARSPIPICGSEAFSTIHDFHRFIEGRGLDIVQPSLTSCGGFGQARQIANLALVNNLRVSPSVWGNPLALAAALHFAASLPTAPHSENIPYPTMIEYDIGNNPLRDRALKTPLQFEAGEIYLPSGPGLGVEIDFDALEDFAILS